jgi:uncharacterized protein
MSILGMIFLIFFASQAYWAWAAARLIGRCFRSTRTRLAVGAVLLGVYIFLFTFNIGTWGKRGTPVHLTPADAFFSAPFLWWAATSLFAFFVVIPIGIVKAAARAVAWARHKPHAIESPARRLFFERTVTAITAAPFVAGAYGLLYGRLNLETTHQQIRLARLPGAFHGFRIAQLSDIHIGPFMPEEEIRKYVAIVNELKPHVIVLTGDFVTWDARTQEAVVRSLFGLKAPFGVFGCLGNHDAWAGVEDSITALFRNAGTRILRQERAQIAYGDEALNLIGVDFESRRGMGPSAPTPHLLAGVPGLMAPDRVNILLSHNPDTFDRAAEIGVDLSLAGHTHGGQAALEFISPEIAPSRLVTPYVAGWFEKPGGQLYVNRGIGTIGVPIRIGAPPEITVFELVRS